MPGSIDPISSPSPRAWAALIVTAASASDGRQLQRRGRRRVIDQRQARRRRRARVEVGASATGHAPLDEASGPARSAPCIRNQVVAGSSVGDDRPAARGGARRGRRSPPRDGAARWSAESAPISAASSAPPLGASSSAWRRGRRPSRAAASRIRRDCVGAEDAGSQKTSAKRASALGGDTRQLLVETVADVGLASPSGRARNSAGTAWAPSHVGRTSIGPSVAELVGDLEEPELGRQVEPVAGLGLDRRRRRGPASRASQRRPCSASSSSRRRARRGDRRQDPAAGGEDLEVVRAALAERPARPRASRANSRWVCGSMRPGRDRAAARVEPGEPRQRVAAPPRAPARGPCAARPRGSGPPSRRRRRASGRSPPGRDDGRHRPGLRRAGGRRRASRSRRRRSMSSPGSALGGAAALDQAQRRSRRAAVTRSTRRRRGREPQLEGHRRARSRAAGAQAAARREARLDGPSRRGAGVVGDGHRRRPAAPARSAPIRASSTPSSAATSRTVSQTTPHAASSRSRAGSSRPGRAPSSSIMNPLRLDAAAGRRRIRGRDGRSASRARRRSSRG